MSDQERPLSRRERRAQEQREAHRLDDTAALEPGLDSHGIPLFAPDGRPLSRRERRRLERLQNPVETWTAEEEMIATGQIPAMTPDRIAEQERIARDKAEAAQREARVASEEILQPGTEAVEARPEPHDAAERRTSLLPESPAEPTSAPEPESTPAPEPEASFEDQHEATAEPVAEPAPQPEPDPVFEPEPQAEQDLTPDPEPVSEPERPLGMPPGMTPEMFDMLFPPGSAQRKLMEEQAGGQPAPSAPSAPHASSTGGPDVGEQSAPSPADPYASEVDESVEVDAHEPSAPATSDAPSSESPWQHTPSEPQWEPAAESDATPVVDETPEPWGYEPSPAEPERPVDLWATVHADADSPSSPDPQEPSLKPWEPSEESRSAASADSFDDIVSASSAEELSPATGAHPVFAPVSSGSATSAHSAAEGSEASPWDAHPLATAEVKAVTGEVDVDVDEEELESEPLPRPDLSNVRTSTHAPIPDVEPVPTGNFEVEPREKPELHPAGGARHFGWAQLAVLGAVAFALGVIVWNVMKGS